MKQGTPPLQRQANARAMQRHQAMGAAANLTKWGGRLTMPPPLLDQAIDLGLFSRMIKGWNAHRAGADLVVLEQRPNLVVDSGIQRGLDRLFDIGGPTPGALQTIGLDDGAGAPVAGTTSSSAGSSNRRLVAFDSTPTRSTNVVSAVGSFDETTVNFVMRRLFLSAANPGTTDAAGDLYAMTSSFSIDFTGLPGGATWDITFTALVTGTGS